MLKTPGNFVLDSQKILNGDPAASPLGGAHRRSAPYSSHRAPQRVRLRLFLVCGLVDRRFEHPHEDIPPSMNQSSIAP
jgi:hypothetical protein